MSPRGPAVPAAYTEDYILESGFLAIEKALDTIYTELEIPEGRALDKLWNERLKKYALKVDLAAQTAAETVLRDRFAQQIEIRGEESSLDELGSSGLAALLDMLDGTDLLERNLGNWCSAMVLYDTKKPQIWAAFVGLPNREIYYAKHSDRKAYVREPKTNHPPIIRTVGSERKTVKLCNASICFYGQKASSFLSLATHRSFLKALNEFAKLAKVLKDQPGAPQLRIYNLAGNPMMINLIEGKMDAIVEMRGQLCHDVVPGFVIALRAGATLYNLETNRRIKESQLASLLSAPNRKFKYVMACNEALAKEIIGLLSGK
jgi:fructose-1,6-bisphosphatase/inositol monophosphatase family enzyme